jgi:hypothetical protein
MQERPVMVKMMLAEFVFGYESLFVGSKKRICWIFGFTETIDECEVTLTHSMVSGKRVSLLFHMFLLCLLL